MTIPPMSRDQALTACGRLVDLALCLHHEYLTLASTVAPHLSDSEAQSLVEHVRRVTADFGTAMAEVGKHGRPDAFDAGPPGAAS